MMRPVSIAGSEGRASGFSPSATCVASNFGQNSQMAKRVSASDAKNNFGGQLEDVAALGRVDILKHGRLVAVMLSPRMLHSPEAAGDAPELDRQWGEKHMIPPELARAARMLSVPSDFDDE